ncbi:(Na+)-NQR maturation NqrM [Candidatus Enterovibrio escicola]|nr:(Na+)-NQR maturation NqrM [Candidatus Enterovibrio escacola]
MSVYLIACSVYLLVMACMLIGYVIQRKIITGSCGGLASIGIEMKCDYCSDQCDARKHREALTIKKVE